MRWFMKRLLPLLFAVFSVLTLRAQDSLVLSPQPADTIAAAVTPQEVLADSVVAPAVSLPSAALDSVVMSTADEYPRISLLTCSPGVEIYEQYGHTAIRYEDPSKGLDVVFNYGLFSFEAPHFIWRFCLGKTDYIVGASEYAFFEREYLDRGSYITSQVLDLTPGEARHFGQLITENCLPKNRTYRYNFLYKNCSTMARDILYRSLGTPLSFAPEGESVTFRQLLHQHNASYPWCSFGVDLVLGAEVDRPIGHDLQEFAPACLMSTFASATRNGAPFVKSTDKIGPVHPFPSTFTFPLTPMQLMILLLLLTAVVCTYELLKHCRVWGYDVFLYGVQGVAGVVIAFLFFFSGHPAVDSNALVVLFNPLAFVLLPFILRQTRRSRTHWALWAELALIIGLVVTVVCVGQEVPLAAWVFVAALLLRTGHHLLKSYVKKL